VLAVSEFPIYEAALVRAAHRRYGWRRRGRRVAVAVAAAAVAGVVLLVARPGPPDVERPAVVKWTTTDVPRFGVAVSVPAGWRLAPRSLTPALTEPREIVTATTFRAVPVIGSCAQFPGVRLGPGDALVSVQEWGGAAAFAPRPARFAAVPISPVTGRIVQSCTGGADAISYQSFSVGMRNFNALVVADPRASSKVRGQAYEILDRLRFDQGFMPWWR
jgi:hypothetical protein